MASVNTKDIPEIKGFMEDFWKMVKEFWIPETNDQYWRDAIARVDELTKKYPHDFCRGQCLQYLDYLEDKWKEELKHGEGL